MEIRCVFPQNGNTHGGYATTFCLVPAVSKNRRGLKHDFFAVQRPFL